MFGACGWFPDSAHKEDRNRVHVKDAYQLCMCGCCACVSEWVDGFEETWQQLQCSPQGKMQLWQLCALVCVSFMSSRTTVCVSQCKWKQGKRRKHECSACQAMGIWGVGEASHRGEKKEWKEGRDAAWGPTQQTDIIYERRRKRRGRYEERKGGGEHLDQRSEKKKKKKRLDVFQSIPVLKITN